jgi:hypothetical protein
VAPFVLLLTLSHRRHVAPARALLPLPAHAVHAAAVATPFPVKTQRHRVKEQPKTFFAPVFMIEQQQQQQQLQQQLLLQQQQQSLPEREEFSA